MVPLKGHNAETSLHILRTYCQERPVPGEGCLVWQGGGAAAEKALKKMYWHPSSSSELKGRDTGGDGTPGGSVPSSCAAGHHGLDLTSWPLTTAMNNIREPMQLLNPSTFKYHFDAQNARKATCLLVQVEAPNLLRCERFENEEATHHAEQYFLTWWSTLPPREYYQVTWYISWSPCQDCAVEVATFLESHGNVSLSIFAARLYYHQKQKNRLGLHRLVLAGAKIKIMDLQDFENCWRNFVSLQAFQPWKKLQENCRKWTTELQGIFRGAGGPEGQGPPENGFCRLYRNATDLLTSKTFRLQFNNIHRLKKPYYSRDAYLCYRLDGPQRAQRCFWYKMKEEKKENLNLPLGPASRPAQAVEKAVRHFLDELQALNLDPVRKHSVTCYCTWSPSPRAAQWLAGFLRDHPHVSLVLFSARLYYHWLWGHQEGLRLLAHAGARVAVMSGREFADCWETFVDHRGKPCAPDVLRALDSRSGSIARRLQRILGDTPNLLAEAFGNLQL
ncbi:DNA dC-_dU-editing enzyme APOBEC-3F-like isoform X2 [Tenrec ecaudatus]|uniref:DNA dC->dU-editing enzyme APOBEC-3F-like isoform X2 n=1 Tax=Tenrec ecaudatus TaxID=94439 RepID=UPI003F59CEF7